jgi:hypothetical protein
MSEQSPRFIAHDFPAGSSILVDRKAKTLTFYHKNIYGQLYDLRKPECVAVGTKLRMGIIRRANSDNGFHNIKVVVSHIYAYLMSPEEQEKCASKPPVPWDAKIVETDDFHAAVAAMCEWAYDRENNGSGDNRLTGKSKTAMLRYCEEFLSENPAPPMPTPKARAGRTR